MNSDSIFKKCFKGCGGGDLHSLDMAADAFQDCITPECGSNPASQLAFTDYTPTPADECETRQFNMLRQACQPSGPVYPPRPLINPAPLPPKPVTPKPRPVSAKLTPIQKAGIAVGSTIAVALTVYLIIRAIRA